jgi:Mg2+/Co2+ transporter CorC
VFALVTSVLSLIIFSEILPQSVCSRHALQVGAYLIDLVKVLCVIFYPIAAPIAYLLDLMLGQELGTVYDRDGLKGLIDVHARSKYGVLTDDETSIMKGTLDFSLKTVKDAMTRAEDVFMLDLETRLDRATMLEMLRRGHSRIPLYEGDRNDVVCLLLLKQLVLVDVDDELPIRALVSNKKRSHKVRVAPALHCTPSTSLSEVLREFQRGRSHMAIVYNKITGPQEERKVLGIVTIEDLIEELIGNINDETDVYISNESKDPVLVRGPDGKLMRITHSRLPGTRTIVVKEIDVERLKRPLVAALRGQKIVPDWKRTSPTDYGSVSFSSDHLPNVEYWRESSRPATPLPPKAQRDQSMDEDDCAEGRAGKDPKDLLRVRKRQYSLEPIIPDDEAGPSLKWKEWKSGVPDSPDVASASSPKSTCSKSEFSRPTEQATLDIARFHGTLPESEKEK